MRRVRIILAALLMVLPPLSALAQYKSGTAQDYLAAHADNPWSTMALSVLGAGSIPTDHLTSIQGTKAIDYEGPILAITALGKDPRTFGATDYVAKLKSFHTENQIGDPATLNDDIFGLLALVSAGEPMTDEALSDAKTFILAHQQPNGGWGFSTGGGTDSNSTASAIVALIAGGTNKTNAVLQNALSYLKTAQNADGGFTYDPQSQYGTASDASSTAWVLWALNAAGINATDWTKDGESPVDYLESTQTPQGYFAYQSGTPEDSFSAATTAYAVIALQGKTLPLAILPTVEKQFPFRIEGKTTQICEGKTQGPTALDIVKNASTLCAFTYHVQTTSFGPYLDQIADDTAQGLIGWLYLVNDTSGSVGAGEYQVQATDTVVWYYGDYQWKPTRLSLSATSASSGGSLKATVESFADNVWAPLKDATIHVGTATVTTAEDGTANVSGSDGYYKIFAEKEGFIRSNAMTVKIGEPTSGAVGLSATIDAPAAAVPESTVSFSVTPTAIEFGTLKPGVAAEKNISIKNGGTSTITVATMVSGNALFTDNIAVTGVGWRNFQKAVGSNQTQSVAVRLNVPSGYSGGGGKKSGSITFWAIPQ
ncbi:DUF4430 domain-containing protein [Candidatus Uhrbacteria bacterium]|nr:DUF4430 domain-containing protein [Candidatus Uhrbacteria bacterium]